MSNGSGAVGFIEILPYNEEKSESDDQIMREYILDESKKFCCIRISLNRDKTDQSVMNIIMSSFNFLGIFDKVLPALQTEANEYLAKGGERIFGKIEPGESKDIIVHLMKYVPDSSNGYHIEDLNEKRIYKDKGQILVPLDGKLLRTYAEETDCYFNGFFKSTPNYKELYFDIIIYEGEIKMAFGHPNIY